MGLFALPKVAQWNLLQSCQGLSVNFGKLDDSWLSRVPRLKRLHMQVCNRRNSFDSSGMGAFVKFLADKCPLLEYLKLELHDHIIVKRDAFARIPARLKRLVLAFDDCHIEGLQTAHFINPEKGGIAQQICIHLRPWIPSSCALFVLKALSDIGIEDTDSLIMNPECAARA